MHVAFGHACLHGSGLQSAQGRLPEPWLTCPEACCSSCCRQALLHNSLVQSSWVCLPSATCRNTCFLVTATHACCLACVRGMLAYRHLHDGHAVLWHASAYHYFTPSCSGAEVQRVTQAAAEEVALATSNICLSAIQHSWCSAMQYVPDVCSHLLCIAAGAHK